MQTERILNDLGNLFSGTQSLQNQSRYPALYQMWQESKVHEEAELWWVKPNQRFISRSKINMIGNNHD